MGSPAPARRDSQPAMSLAIAQRIAPDLVELRRRLHQVPEIGLDLPVTQGLVLEALAGIDLEITPGRGLSSVTAVLRGGAQRGEGPRPAVLLRGDMDALPVAEEVDVPLPVDAIRRSCTPAVTTCTWPRLVGAARILRRAPGRARRRRRADVPARRGGPGRCRPDDPGGRARGQRDARLGGLRPARVLVGAPARAPGSAGRDR